MAYACYTSCVRINFLAFLLGGENGAGDLKIVQGLQ